MSTGRLSVGPRALLRAAAVAATLALAACATPPPAVPTADLQATQPDHTYTGRFAVRYDDQLGHTRDVYGNFDWQEHAGNISLALRSPLGQTLAIVRAAPGEASLELPNQPIQYAADVAELMQNALGFSLPIDGLRYWLLPAPSPATPAAATRDASHAGRLSQLRQDGWTIDYLAYADASATDVKRVDLARNDPPLTIKLVLDR